MKAFIFPGQGAQFTGMGKDIYEANPKAKALFDSADRILGFDISRTMFSGSADELKQTNVTQPAIFIHSVAIALSQDGQFPDMVAGHSQAMQNACELNPSTMAAILGLEDKVVEEICASIDDVVVAANYNCPGQLVISGTLKGIEIACEKLKAAGAKRALPLQVGGAFHSPLMEPAREELAAAIDATHFDSPICPVYQNVNGLPSTNVSEIKKNLISQLTAPVRWTQSVQNMSKDGATIFIESGPGKVLQGLVKKISPQAEVASL